MKSPTKFFQYLQANLFIAVLPFFLHGLLPPQGILNSITYVVGFETWNQWNSDLEDEKNNKKRPKMNKNITFALWVICFLLSSPVVKIWLLLCPLVYLSGNNSPLKEMLMFYGIFVHYYYLSLPIDFIHILRHALTGSIQDVRDLEGDKAANRLTLPMIFHFPSFYLLLTTFFLFISEVPLHSLIIYGIVALLSEKYPNFSYKLWQFNYVLELFIRANGPVLGTPLSLLG